MRKQSYGKKKKKKEKKKEHLYMLNAKYIW